ncbi:GNAT family N-acetyltransferase [Rhodoferax ferrireducens]|uniref:GNAT family N-acetyltransferase n=1 Tax=Rhodoferax ferrireducens TaxID=192843 RepID=UPI00298DD103|nr:GNAT family N-acetyltransferase [Rhodoferax ferrireducens]WPC68889.1 GNAT family N-acetyltransferase [Rhodoferax ferrireducens]
MQALFQLTNISTPADYEIFKGLLLEYAARDLDDPKNSTIWKDIEQLPGRYAAPVGAVVLATVGGELAGCGAYTATAHSGIAEIKRVYVRDGFRRQGLARALTQALISRARQAGYATAAICTWPHNTQALALYQQLGFVPISSFREPSKAHLVFLGLPLGQSGPDTNTLPA